MAVLGEIIKKAIEVYGFISPDPDPVKMQGTVLKDLLTKARFTAFGKKYGFSGLLQSDELYENFREKVPVHDYDKMYAEWWHYLLEGFQNVTWPGGQQYFALSSGTTSHSKYIPVTDDMVEAIRKAAIQQVLSLRNFDLPADFFGKQVLMLGSSTSLIEKEDHLEGEISGISASNIPTWFRGYYKPGEDIAGISDWDEKVSRIAKEAPNWDIGGISGIPSWIEMMLKEVIRYNNLNTIHDIWPNLQVYTPGGVAYEPYKKSFEKLLSGPLHFIDTYLASEGYLATQKRPETTSMALIVDNGIFFEFVPLTDRNMDEDGRVKPDAEVYSLKDVEENVEYVLLISTVAGAWRYMIGDTVIITDKKRAEIKISGRTKHYLNVVGEQLSVHQMNMAIQNLEQEFNMEVKEYVVCTFLQNEEYVSKWIVGADNIPSGDAVAGSIDTFLQENNKNYKVARTKALKRIEAEVVSVEKIYNWSEKFKKLGGQAKIPRVMKAEDFEAFQDYIHSLS
jgi:hypothetical protein